MENKRYVIYKKGEVEIDSNKYVFGKLLEFYPQIEKIERTTGFNKFGQYISHIYINGTIYLPLDDPNIALGLLHKEYIINFETKEMERCW